MPDTQITIPPSSDALSPPVKTSFSPVTESSSNNPLPTTSDSELDINDPHRFIPPTADCSRSPCPVLNALANHGYLPRSGRKITFCNLVKILKEVVGLSTVMSLFLTIASYFLLKKWFTRPLDLHETAAHNRIEHDASLVHADADTDHPSPDKVVYAPTTVDPVLLRRLLNIASPLRQGGENVYTTSTIARYRVEREAESKLPLDGLHAEIGHGEGSLILHVFGKQDENGRWYVDESIVAEVFGRERFPRGWKPARVAGLISIVKTSSEIKRQMEEIRKESGPKSA